MAARLEVITGPMFSKKSTRLIEKLDWAVHEKKSVLLIKPKADTRNKGVAFRKKAVKMGGEDFEEFDAHIVNSAEEISELFEKLKPNVVGMDEVHFAGFWLLDWIVKAMKQHRADDLLIVAAGLDMDYRGKPFKIMPGLMARADRVTKRIAVCEICRGKNGPGVLTQKKTSSKLQIEPGGKETYGVACRACHTIPN